MAPYWAGSRLCHNSLLDYQIAAGCDSVWTTDPLQSLRDIFPPEHKSGNTLADGQHEDSIVAIDEIFLNLVQGRADLMKIVWICHILFKACLTFCTDYSSETLLAAAARYKPHIAFAHTQFISSTLDVTKIHFAAVATVVGGDIT